MHRDWLSREHGLCSRSQFAADAHTPASLVARLRLGHALRGHEGCINCVSWSNDGQLLLSSSDDCMVRAWRFGDYATQHVYHSGHAGNVFCIRQLPQLPQLVATAAADGLLRISNLEHGSSYTFAGHQGIVHKLAVGEDNPTLVYTASGDGTVRRYDVRCADRHGTLLFAPPARKGSNTAPASSLRAVHAIQLEPTGRPHLLIGGAEGSARVYDLRCLASSSPSGSASASSHGAGSSGQGMGVWAGVQGGGRANNRRCLLARYVPPHLADAPKTITSVAYSDNGRRILSSYLGDNIFMFEAQGLQGGNSGSVGAPGAPAAAASTVGTVGAGAAEPDASGAGGPSSTAPGTGNAVQGDGPTAQAPAAGGGPPPAHASASPCALPAQSFQATSPTAAAAAPPLLLSAPSTLEPHVWQAAAAAAAVAAAAAADATPSQRPSQSPGHSSAWSSLSPATPPSASRQLAATPPSWLGTPQSVGVPAHPGMAQPVQGPESPTRAFTGTSLQQQQAGALASSAPPAAGAASAAAGGQAVSQDGQQGAGAGAPAAGLEHIGRQPPAQQQQGADNASQPAQPMVQQFSVYDRQSASEPPPQKFTLSRWRGFWDTVAARRRRRGRHRRPSGSGSGSDSAGASSSASIGSSDDSSSDDEGGGRQQQGGVGRSHEAGHAGTGISAAAGGSSGVQRHPEPGPSTSAHTHNHHHHNHQPGGHHLGVTVTDVVRTYHGHLNYRTIKDVAFMGPRSQWVVSGSDDGRLYVWGAESERLVLMQRGDQRAVNCMALHPAACVLATGGIDSEVKIWEPTAEEADDLATAEQVSRDNAEHLADPHRSLTIPVELLRALLAGRRRPGVQL